MKPVTEMCTCANCGILFPESFIVSGECGAVVIGADAYCSQACAEGVYLTKPFDEYDHTRGDK